MEMNLFGSKKDNSEENPFEAMLAESLAEVVKQADLGDTPRRMSPYSRDKDHSYPYEYSPYKESTYWSIPVATYKAIREEIMNCCFDIKVYKSDVVHGYHCNDYSLSTLVPKEKYKTWEYGDSGKGEEFLETPLSAENDVRISFWDAVPLSFSLNDKMTLALLEEL